MNFLISVLRWACFYCIFTLVLSSPQKSISNSEILSKLGLKKLRISPSHHKKRLAVESRHHQSQDDSHMFVVKLPPNPYYYAHSVNPNAIPNTGKNLPVGFKSNGKPGKIYHWNIPILKKVATQQTRPRLDDSDNDTYKESKRRVKPMKDFERFANEVHDKITNINRKYQKSPTYYAPGKKHNLHKYYAHGNGKPKSFYVIEKSKKPHYHRLLP